MPLPLDGAGDEARDVVLHEEGVDECSRGQVSCQIRSHYVPVRVPQVRHWAHLLIGRGQLEYFPCLIKFGETDERAYAVYALNAPSKSSTRGPAASPDLRRTRTWPMRPSSTLRALLISLSVFSTAASRLGNLPPPTRAVQ